MTDNHQPLRDALADVKGLLGQPSLHSGHVTYAETEEWCSVDINVKLAANKHISGRLAKFIKEAANPAAISALLADLDAAVGALNDATTSLETISGLAGKATYPSGDDTCMGTFPEVRAYATSRAFVARAALSQIRAGREQA